MKITKDQLLNFLTDLSLAYELPPLIEKVEEVIEALQNEELEIEGYVREDHLRDTTKMADEWIKFDPNDESTFPPKGKFLYFDGFGIAIGIHLQCERKDGFVHVYRKITHWRPLPKPPVEQEEKCG